MSFCLCSPKGCPCVCRYTESPTWSLRFAIPLVSYVHGQWHGVFQQVCTDTLPCEEATHNCNSCVCACAPCSALQVSFDPTKALWNRRDKMLKFVTVLQQRQDKLLVRQMKGAGNHALVGGGATPCNSSL